MAVIPFNVLDQDVDDVIKEVIGRRYRRLTFSYSLVPNKSINDGGLGASWNGWRSILDRIQLELRRKRPEYRTFKIGTQDAYHTLGRTLISTRIQIRKGLIICVELTDESN